jgi:formylglycine-generating enzyme required for sulfatase activity
MRPCTIAMVVVFLAFGCEDDTSKTKIEITPMVYFTSPSKYLFGDDHGCPALACEAGAEVTEVYPKITAWLSGFAIDIHEVTNEQYQDCVQAGDCPDLAGYNLSAAALESYHRNEMYMDHPVVNVSWTQADAYCKVQGKRLPTELEWEYVVRAGGKNGKLFPFGDDLDECGDKDIQVKYCNADVTEPAAAMSALDDVVYIEGAGAVYDMMGNVSEWMSHRDDPLLTCARDADFDHQCGDGCEADCVPMGAVCDADCLVCRSNCRRCEFCAEDGPNDCFRVCGDLAMCLKKAATAYLSSDTEFDAEGGGDRMYRGGNFQVNKKAQIRGPQGTCSLRASSRNLNMEPTRYADWIGFRCAQDF